MSLPSDLASYFDLFGFECFFCYFHDFWIFDFLCFGSYATDEMLLLEMYLNIPYLSDLGNFVFSVHKLTNIFHFHRCNTTTTPPLSPSSLILWKLSKLRQVFLFPCVPFMHYQNSSPTQSNTISSFHSPSQRNQLWLSVHAWKWKDKG